MVVIPEILILLVSELSFCVVVRKAYRALRLIFIIRLLEAGCMFHFLVGLQGCGTSSGAGLPFSSPPTNCSSASPDVRHNNVFQKNWNFEHHISGKVIKYNRERLFCQISISSLYFCFCKTAC